MIILVLSVEGIMVILEGIMIRLVVEGDGIVFELDYWIIIFVLNL